MVYTQEFSGQEQPWLRDHRVFDRVVAPGALYLSMALATSALPGRLAEVSIQQAMVLEEEERSCRQVQLVLQPAGEDGQQDFQLFSKSVSEEDGWALHARGRLEPLPRVSEEEDRPEPLETLWNHLQEQSVEAFYQAFNAVGIAYGPSFQGLSALWAGEGEALGEIRTPPELPTNGLALHPAVLDACLQVTGAATVSDRQSEEAYVPFQLERLDLVGEVPGHFYCHARLREAIADNRETLTADLWLRDESNQLLGRITGLVLKRATPQTMLAGRKAKIEDWLYEVKWQEQPRIGQVMAADFWPAVSSIADRVQPMASGLVQEAGLGTADRRLLEAMEELSRHYIVQAFKQLGWSAGVGEAVDRDDLLSRLGILPSHGKLVGRMLEVLAGGGLLERDGSQWRVVRDLPHDPTRLWQELVEHYPRGQVELTLLGRCGEQLAEVLAGKLAPLGLLFPQEGIRAEDLYRDAPVARVFNGLVRESVRQALAAFHPIGICGYWRSGRGPGARPAMCSRSCRPSGPSTTTPTCPPVSSIGPNSSLPVTRS